MSTTTKDALHQAGTAYREAEAAVKQAEQNMDTAMAKARTQNIQARHAKDQMYDVFYHMAGLSHRVLDLRCAVTSYDLAHDRAMKERNDAGDDMDRAARMQNFTVCHGPEDLERSAVRYAAAQEVLTHLEKGEASAKRRRDVVALRQSESEHDNWERQYKEKISTFKCEHRKAQSLDQKWNEFRGAWQLALDVLDQRRSDLRKAAQAYAASEAAGN